MGLNLEILPQKELSEDWLTALCKHISFDKGELSFEAKRSDYFLLLWNGELAFHLWLQTKEPDILPDFACIEAVKNPDRINANNFLENFKRLSYTIRTEYKGDKEGRGISLMVRAAAILAKWTEGIVLFENEIFEFKVDNIYLPEDLFEK